MSKYDLGKLVRGLKKYLAGTFLSAVLLFSQRAEALPVDQFNKMSVHDRSAFLSLMYDGALSQLKSEGKQDEINKLNVIFTTPDSKTPSPAFLQFLQNVYIVQQVNEDNAKKDPTKKPFDAEVAFDATLKDNGINVPVKVLRVASKDFKPSAPSSPSVTETKKP